MCAKNSIAVGGKRLTIDQLVSIVYESIPVTLAQTGVKNIEKSHETLLGLLKTDQTVYGMITGFGALSTVRVPIEKMRELQLNMVRSHTCGTGEPLPELVVKTIMVLIAHGLAQGYSGCRRVVVDTLINMINKGVYPVVPSQGSIGASGDLILLAHIASVVIGEGEAIYQGTCFLGKAAMRRAGIPTLTLERREGVSLVNGTYAMSALGSLAVHRAETLNKLADVSGAMTLEVILGTKVAANAKIHKIRPHPGQIATAANIRKLVEGSEIIESHKFCDRVQDAYSLRCIPQVHGAVKDAVRYCRSTVAVEINSVTDNPLVFDKGVISAGNFHGQPLAISLDTLGIAMTDLGNIVERRVDRLMNPVLSELPAFLSPNPGLNSGYMMAHYLAASISLENRGLATPASVDSVPVSANKEDYNSNGMWSARKAWQIVENTERLIAIELLCTVQGIDFRKGYKPGRGSRAAYDVIRQSVPMLKRDRVVQKDIHLVLGLIQSGQILDAVENAVGTLEI